MNAVAALEDLYAQLRIIAMDEPLARQAGELASQHALRGYDAVHLACRCTSKARTCCWQRGIWPSTPRRATGRLIANDTG